MVGQHLFRMRRIFLAGRRVNVAVSMSTDNLRMASGKFTLLPHRENLYPDHPDNPSRASHCTVYSLVLFYSLILSMDSLATT